MKQKKSLQTIRLKKIERNKITRTKKNKLLAMQTLSKKRAERHAKLNKLNQSKTSINTTIVQHDAS